MEVRNRRAVIGGAVAALLLFACLARTGADESGPSTQREAERLFALKVLPLLRTKCFGCHGDDADNIKGEFDMRTRVGLLKGGESEEPSIVAGKPQKSPLYQAVLWDGLEMPPKENDRLTEKEIELVRRWIADGAPWPNEERQQSIRKREWSVQENEDGMLVSTSGGLADSWTYRRYQREDIWAFQPLEKPDVPAGFDNPVDAFVHARLEAKELTAADVADARTLIRRATFDLTGLPPTPKEIDAFEAAWSDN